MLSILMLRQIPWMGCEDFHTSFRCKAVSWEDSVFLLFHMHAVFWIIFSWFRIKILCEFFLDAEMTAYQRWSFHNEIVYFQYILIKHIPCITICSSISILKTFHLCFSIVKPNNSLIFHNRFTFILSRYDGYHFDFPIFMLDDCLKWRHGSN